jgi:FkbM family methyltransferase
MPKITYPGKKKNVVPIENERIDALLAFNGISKSILSDHRCSLQVENEKVTLRKGSRQIRVSVAHAIYLHDLIPYFDLYFSQVKPINMDGFDTADYSETKKQILLDCDLEFYFSSLAEGSIAFNSYVYHLPVHAGETILDAGAYCGVSTYFFSKLVGPTGKVVALEPDTRNFECLLKNIEMHKLSNVIPIKGALWSKKTKLSFFSEGSLGSASSEFNGRPDLKTKIEVDAFSLSDVINAAGLKKVDYVKMDIEGAEIESLKNYTEEELHNLCSRFSIASYHIVDGKTTATFLEPYFRERNFSVKTDAPYQRAQHGGLITYGWKN